MTADDLGNEALEPLDHVALRARYRRERDKRLRRDGASQYVPASGYFAELLDDPYCERRDRDPVKVEATVVIIGGGFAGLVTGARLKAAGVADVRIIDGAGDVGGVWYWNRYPGAACDTAAMVYLPLLEETGTVPSMKYTSGHEIFAHAKRIAERFGLYDGALFSTEVTSLDWHEPSSRWVVRTNRGDEISARFVAMGTGPLHRPRLPGIPGIETFGGHSFHTARWDYAYTGGDATGAPLAGLADKRVGVIGTGATAVQCIPHIARSARRLNVFQRTPSSVDARGNRPIDPEWYASLEPGWQKRWLVNFATLQTGRFADEDLVQDGWTEISQRIRARIQEARRASSVEEVGPALVRQAYEDCDDDKMREIRARVDSIVGDRASAQALKPWYRQLCKRPCFSDVYLQAYNEPSTTLVDTDGRGVDRIDRTGVWVGNEHYELDCLIYATGFAIHFEHSAGYDTTGAGGVTLEKYWADGMRTLHGIHTRGFPNLFIIGVSQGGNLVANITHNLTEAGTTIAAVVAHAVATNALEVEVTAEAEDAWIDLIANSAAGFFGDPDCTPGNYNNEGSPIGRRERLNGSGYPHGPVAFFQYIDDWRDSGQFVGLEFRR